jgi:hypothetical protein
MKLKVKRHKVIQPDDPSIRIIPLTQSQNCIVDAADFEWLNQWNWHACWDPKTKSFYALRKELGNTISMARVILDCSESEMADHKNRKTLDNRRENIRKATPYQNCANRWADSKNSSGYRGVYWDKQTEQWKTSIRHRGKFIHLGYFHLLEDAVNARNEAVQKYHGDFAIPTRPVSHENSARRR